MKKICYAFAKVFFASFSVQGNIKFGDATGFDVMII